MSPAAYQALIWAHIGYVENTARGLRTPKVEHEDIVAAGLLALVEAAQRYEPRRGGFWAFACSHVRGAMWSAVRSWTHFNRREHRAAFEDRSLDVALSEDGTTFADLLPSAEGDPTRAADIIGVLRTLEPRDSEVLVRTACGEHQRAIAERWGVDESRVCQVLSRARRRLREEMA